MLRNPNRRILKTNFHIILSLFICIVANYANAQTRIIDSVITINEINVSSTRVKVFNTGYKIENFDSTLIKNLSNQSLSDLLLMNNAVYIKSYGNGALSMPSLRGTGANHTAVIWNGINLQSNMNGTLDLSMVPLANNYEVYLQYGAASSLYGSGAIGGSINLNNKAQFNQGHHLKISTGLGSFQTIPFLINYNYSGSKWNINLKPYLFSSKNNLILCNLDIVLDKLMLSHQEFIDLCILCGCDYTCTIPKLGHVSALKVITQYRDIDTFIENNKNYKIPNEFYYQTARNLFNSI